MSDAAFQAVCEKVIKISDPARAARMCGFKYDGTAQQGHFHIRLLHSVVYLDFPECTAYFMPEKKPVPQHIVTLLLYHLVTEDGTAPTRHWISFQDLPDGNFYATAFRSYTSQVLERHFRSNLPGVREAGEKLRLTELRFKADLAYLIPVLPKIRIVFVYWAADKEFPAYADFLFDKTAPCHLPTDCYAVLCSWLTQSIIKGRFFYEG